MTGIALEISAEKCGKSTLTRSDKQAWRNYVRRRWPNHTIALTQREWGLNEHQARSLTDGAVSLATIDIIKNHKNGGFMLALDVLCVRFSTSLEEIAAQLEERALNERDHREAEAERWGRTRRSVATAEGVSAGDEA